MYRCDMFSAFFVTANMGIDYGSKENQILGNNKNSEKNCSVYILFHPNLKSLLLKWFRHIITQCLPEYNWTS